METKDVILTFKNIEDASAFALWFELHGKAAFNKSSGDNKKIDIQGNFNTLKFDCCGNKD